MLMPNSLVSSSDLAPDESALYQSVRDILDGAQTRAARSINVEMARAYWLIGQAIVQHEQAGQAGQARAEYGAQLIESLAKRLSADGLKGFNPTNLRHMRNFFVLFPIQHALSGELSWTHYRHLLRVEKQAARDFYERESVAGAWSTRELERQINSLFYERILNMRLHRYSERESLKSRAVIRPTPTLSFRGEWAPDGIRAVRPEESNRFGLFSIFRRAECRFLWSPRLPSE